MNRSEVLDLSRSDLKQICNGQGRNEPL
jgi:hypothetical protein